MARLTVPLVAVLALTVAVPPGELPGPGGFPVGWLLSWLRPAAGWAENSLLGLPRQPDALAAGDEHYVPADATRAGGGAGLPPGKGLGAVDPYAGPVADAGQSGSGATPGEASFNPASSQRIPGAATANSDVYANADGSYTRTVSERPVNYQAGDGSWAPIDRTLVPGSGRYRPRAASTDVSFAPSAADPQLAALRVDATHGLSYALSGAAGVSAVAAGDTLSYPGVLPGTDLRLAATGTGIKESLVLHSAEVATSWLFPLTLQGLTPALEVDGSVILRDSAGVARLRIPAGHMEDSRFDPRSGAFATSSAVSYQLTTVNGQPALRVDADSGWLHDPDRVFPVTVDPTTDGIETSGDTYVLNTSSTDYSGSAELDAGTWDGGTDRAHSFLQFSDFGAAYDGARMSAVSLHIFDSWAYTCTPEPFTVHPVTQAWNVIGYKPYPGPTFGAQIGSVTASPGAACTNTSGDRSIGTWMTVPLDVATFQNWALGAPNYGLAVTASQTDSLQWKRFTSRNGPCCAPYLMVTYTPNVPPQVDVEYPASGSPVGTLTPELLVSAHDPDTWPNPLSYNFLVYDKDGTKIAESGPTAATSWVVPAGRLSWGQSYRWTVVASDGSAASTSQSTNLLLTPVPQPLVTSGLSQNGGQGFEPSVGNYTSSATDASVPTVGPSLAVRRYYNSLDTRTGSAFGAGWSSVLDMAATEASTTGSGTPDLVVVRYPAGQELAFGRNPDGSYAPPPGRFATLTPVTGGGYRLVDKDGTSYLFTAAVTVAGAWSITSITDAAGRAETFGYTVPSAGGVAATITSAAGRALHLSWSTGTQGSPPHVLSVATDPVVAGSPGTALTWSYTYTGNRLTTVCPPTSGTACTTYAYTGRSLHPTTVFNAGPRAYWRLGETTGTLAASAVLGSEGTDSGSYTDATLGQPGPLPGSSSTAAGFNGTSSRVELPAKLPAAASYQSVSMWLRTNGGSGVLLGQSTDPITATTSNAGYQPVLYVGTDGLLRGSFATAPVVGNLGSLVGPGSGRCLDVTGNVSTNGAVVELYDCTGGANQQWSLTSANELRVTIGGVTKCLDATGGGTADGTRLQIWDCTGGANQKWTLSADGRVVGQQSGRCVDAYGYGTANGTPTQLWSCFAPVPGNQAWFPSAHATITSAASVADNRWHQVVLTAAGSTQTMYLDGQPVGSRTAAVQDPGVKYQYLGAGFAGGGWPAQPHPGNAANTGYPMFFSGSIAEVAAFDRPLSAATVSTMYRAGAAAADVLSSVVRPSGNPSATVDYDTGTGTVSQVTDANGGVWRIGAPAASGSSQVYAGTVLAAGPADYWRLAETGTAQAINQVNGSTASYNQVTLGVAGSPVGDGTVAGFDGTSSYLSLSSADAPTTGPNSVGMWFKTPAGSTAGGVLYGYGRKQLSDPAATDGPWNGPDVADLYLADLDGDGDADAVKRSTDGNLYGYPNVGRLGTAVNYGARVTIGAGWNAADIADVYFADLDGDRKAEVIKRTTGGDLVAFPNVNALAFNWGPGRTVSAGWNAADILGVHFADLDGDRKAEVIKRTTGGDLVAFPNVNALAYSWGPARTIGSGWADASIVGVAFADLDGDLKSEVVKRMTTGDLVAFPNVTGITGVWGAGRTIGTGWASPTVGGVLFADIDADAKAEVLNRASAGDLWAFPNVTGITGVWGAQRKLRGASWTGSGVPALYVGTDGKLYAQFWCENTGSMLTTAGTVNDGNWHQVVLTGGTGGQTLYLDGAQVGTITGPLVDYAASSASIGAGAVNGPWPATPTDALGHFTGQLAEVAFYRSQLSAAQVAAQFQARGSSAGPPVKTVTVTDPGNHPIVHTYDLLTGRQVAEVDALGNRTQYGYDENGFLRTVTDPNGNVTTTEHDVRGNTVSSTTCQNQAANRCSTVYHTYYPDATTRVLTPDPRNDLMLTGRDGRSTSATDNTYLTSYGYDTNGNRTTVTDPLGRVTTTTYTDGSTVAAYDTGFAPAGLPATLTTAGGARQTVAYYRSGDVAQVTDPAGKITRYTYDGIGRVLTTTEITDRFPAGLSTSYGYDGLSRVVSQTAPAVTNRVTGAVHTAVTTSRYDDDGLLTGQTVSDTTGGDAARTVSTTYNVHGQPETSTDPTNRTTRYEYDAYGNAIREFDADGGRIDSSYDAEGHLLTSTLIGYTGDPNNPEPARDLTVSSRAYDPAGRLASVTDAMGWVTAYTYTDNGLAATTTRRDPGTGAGFVAESNTYDAAGQLASRTVNDGATTTTYTVDAAGRTTSSTLDPNGLARTTTYTYSADDHPVLTTASDSAGAVVARTETMYDPLGRPLAETVHTGLMAPVGRWPLNQTAGTSAPDSAGNSPGTAAGGVTWSTEHGGAAAFDGTGTITTAAPVLDTARSLSVSAWVKLASGSATAVVAGQDGARNSGFSLWYDQPTGRWRFGMPRADTDGATVDAAQSPTAAQVGTWTHLCGLYDAAAGTLSLYVNGQLAGTATHTGAWPALGPLTIGRQKAAGSAQMATAWRGSITDLQVYSRALTSAEIGAVFAGTAPAAGASVIRTSYALDTAGQPLSRTDPSGNTTNLDYDEAGQLAVSTGPAVATETGGGTPVTSRPVSYVGYDTFGEQVETRDPNGNVTLVGYDAAGRLVSSTLPSYTPPGSTTAIVAQYARTYDSLGQLASTTDPLNHQTTYSYDQLGRLAKVTAPNLGETKYSYDLVGDRLSATDPTGAVTTATYDYLGRRRTATQVVRQAGANYTTSYDYGAGGWLSATHSPAGVPTSYTYNAAGQPVTVTDGANNVTTQAYDAAGRGIRSTLPDNSYTTTGYDLAGRALSSTSYDPAGVALATRSTGYDRGGHVTTATDARGTTTTFAYDASGLLVSEDQPISGSDSIQTSFGYDQGGNRTRFTDGRGHPFVTTYNSWSLAESQIEPSTTAHPGLADRTFTLGYDAAGRVATQLAPGGVTVTNSYDEVGNLTGRTGAGAEVATAARTFGYDLAGRLISASAPGGTDTFSWDDRGLLRTTAGPSGTASFGYNPDGAMASRTDAAGTTDYMYDTAGRLAGVTNSGAGVAVAYTYNSLSQPSILTYGTLGNTRTLGYDGLHRVASDELKTATGTSIAKISYGYDANGNETSKTTTGFTGSAVNTYGYDLADRLTSWTVGATSTVYAYDKSGNRVQAGSRLFSYDERNRLVSSGGTQYAYTARGTLSSTVAGGATLTTESDAFGQVTRQFATATQAQAYQYDALGRAIRSGFSYSGVGNTLAGDGASTYTRGPSGELVGVAAGATGVHAWTDRHSDLVGEFTATGTALAGSTSFDPLGRVLGSVAMIGALGYQSEWTEQSTGRVNMWARWYNTDTGQFDTRDTASPNPIPASVDANLYGYGSDNPLTVTDPTGHFSWRDSWHSATSAVSRGWNSFTSTVSSMWSSASSYLGDRADDLRTWASNKIDRARAWVNDKADQTRTWVNKKVDQGRKWVSHQAERVKQQARQVYTRAKQAARTVAVQYVRVAQHVVHTVKDAYAAADKWVKEHKDAIIEVAAIAAGVLAGLACTAVTGGVGAVACMVGASALINLAKDAAQGDVHSVGDALGSLGTGAVQGLAGGVGGVVGGRVAGLVVGRLGGVAASVGGRVLSGALAGAVGGAVGDVGAQLATTGRVQWGGVAAAAGVGAVFGAAGGARGAGRSRSGSAQRAPGERSAEGEAPTSCKIAHSFDPGTPVLMADGSRRPIGDVNVGDRVAATDPVTGSTSARSVVALHLNRDSELTEVTVSVTAASVSSASASVPVPVLGPRAASAVGTGLRVAGGAVLAGVDGSAGSGGSVGVSAGAGAAGGAGTVAGGGSAGVGVTGSAGVSVLRTTQHHPFWDDTAKRWVPAGELVVGHQLRTLGGGSATVTGVHNHTGAVVMRDLTVDTVHTYYVIAGNTPVLVHNCNTASPSDLRPTHSISGDSSTKRVASMRNQMRDGTFDWEESGPISIAKNGDDMYVLDGHHRLEAAKRAGLEEVPIQDVTDQLVTGGFRGYADMDDVIRSAQTFMGNRLNPYKLR